MAWTVDVAFVHEFENNITSMSQEGQNVLGWVRQKAGQRGKTYNVERLQGVEMVEIASRHQPTQLTPFTHTRRRLTLSDYGLSEIIDDIDEVKMLVSPESDYARNFALAYNRRSAQTLFAAMTGSASSVGSDDTATAVALPAGQQIANAGTGLTVGKVRQAARILSVNGQPQGDRHFATSPFGIEDLLSDTTVTSADFSTLQALMNGTIPDGSRWMGFAWHVITDALGGGTTMASPILPKTGNIRSSFAWHKNSTVFSAARDFQVEMPRDPGIWNNLRVMVKVSQGCVRVEDEGVVRVDLDETA